MSAEPELRLLVELEAEAARWRRRTMFLLSVILHGVMIGLLLFAPNIFRRGAEMMGIRLEPAPKRQTTFLWLPPDLLKRLREPPDTSTLADKNRRAQGRSPVIDPNGLHMPYLRGNTPLPEIAGGGKPVPPPPPSPPPGGAASPGAPPAASAPPAPKNEEARLQLMDVRPEPAGGSGSRAALDAAPTGEEIRRAAQAAARGRASGSIPGPGDSTGQFQNLNPNFSIEGPEILSDTRGVDFGRYLYLIVEIVRRNWYAEMPWSAQNGEKGRVDIVFEILKDGSVPEIRLVGSSGKDPLDRAAVAGIRLSRPLPPLPKEFTGDNLVLHFIFLYNLGYTNR